MTLKEKIDSFCAKEIVLHIPTKDLFIKVCDEIKRRGSSGMLALTTHSKHGTIMVRKQ